MPERWTIRDIAGEAGVSTKTVSHVLNGKPGVHNETRAHVLRIIEKVGYHPHLGARMLRGHATVSVGVTMPAPPGAAPLGQSFFVWLYEELFRVFGSRGYYLTFDLNPYATGPNSDYARGIWEQAFQACVLAGPLATSDTTVARIHATGTPYLALGRLDSFPECSCAVVDYEQGAYRGIQYLIERGHKRIGMLKAFDGFQPGVERQRGYVRAMEEAGLPLAAGLVRSVTFGTHDIADTVHRILEMGDVTALL
ncbi:MAG: LacI family DNA-binding transcriptional regulator, partial [Nitrospiraceae bacterium]|nr:LacI family DNA-binding transcriptional regulator [Nitrospiraceae bacterium]